MRSTPVVGGGLFGEGREKKDEDDSGPVGGTSKPLRSSGNGPTLLSFKQSGHAAEIIVDGEVYKIRINDATLRSLRTGFSGDVLNNRGISISGGGMSIQHDENDVVKQLQGYIRSPLGQISEDLAEEGSETSSQKIARDPKEGAL